jgi:alpha-tubulin suppressor-like RCC1 family protein
MPVRSRSVNRWLAAIFMVPATILGCSDSAGPVIDGAIRGIGIYRVDTTGYEMAVVVAESLALRAVVYDTNLGELPGRTITWQTTSALAKINANGVVTGVAPGTTFVRASTGGVSDSIQILVLPEVDSLVLSPVVVGIVPGATTQVYPVLYRNGIPELDYGRPLHWTSSNPAAATVTGNFIGDVSGLATGSTTITATGSGATASMRVDVDLVSFTAIATGDGAYCGLTTTNRVYCQGVNSAQELGHPFVSGSSTPLRVEGIPLGKQVVFGGESGCVLGATGSAWCWGWDIGNLGRGVSPPGNGQMPGPVSGGLTFASLTAGQAVSCGITTIGAAYCWGFGEEGALGTGDALSRNVPTPVQGGLTVASISTTPSYILASYPYDGQRHSCAVTTTGIGYCWGSNTFGQLGNGATTNTLAPVPVGGGLTFSSIAAGWTYTCGVADGGLGYCWGDNTNGQLGSAGGSTTLPRAIDGGLTFSRISAGTRHTCGITTAGAAYCWGRNAAGELGDGSLTASEAPVAVSGGLVFSTISAGRMFTCGVTTNNVGYCWGAPSNETGSMVPVRVLGQP